MLVTGGAYIAVIPKGQPSHPPICLDQPRSAAANGYLVGHRHAPDRARRSDSMNGADWHSIEPESKAWESEVRAIRRPMVGRQGWLVGCGGTSISATGTCCGPTIKMPWRALAFDVAAGNELTAVPRRVCANSGGSLHRCHGPGCGPALQTPGHTKLHYSRRHEILGRIRSHLGTAADERAGQVRSIGYHSPIRVGPEHYRASVPNKTWSGKIFLDWHFEGDIWSM